MRSAAKSSCPAKHGLDCGVGGGNPLFIEQMVAMVAEQGADGVGEVPIPPTIHALLAARLDSYPRESRPGAGLGDRTSSAGMRLRAIPKDEWPAVGGIGGPRPGELPGRCVTRPFGSASAGLPRSHTTPSRSSSVPTSTSVTATGSSRTAVTRRSSATTERAYAYRSAPSPVDAEGRALARRAATRLRRAPGVRARRPSCRGAAVARDRPARAGCGRASGAAGPISARRCASRVSSTAPSPCSRRSSRPPRRPGMTLRRARRSFGFV